MRTNSGNCREALQRHAEKTALRRELVNLSFSVLLALGVLTIAVTACSSH